MATDILNHATVRASTLSDGSVVFDVVYRSSDINVGFVEFGCKDREHAESLADELNDVCWVRLA